MKKKTLYRLLAFGLLLVSSLLVILSCGKQYSDNRNECEKPTAYEVTNESELLVEYLEKNGDPVNCMENCTMTAADVHKMLDENIYIIDLRSKNDFMLGHIEGAVHMSIKKLCYYFNESIHPFRYDKIVFVCYSGQSATYAASLLRMGGFDNVYSMKWGMCAWNHELSNKWSSKTGSKTEITLTDQATTASEKHPFPELKTEKLWRQEMLRERMHANLCIGFKKASISVDKLKEKGNDVFVMAYLSEDIYTLNHPEGAVLFPVRESLKESAMLKLLPNDREIVVYSQNGFESAFATAYLRILGYDAKSLLYGVNSFMDYRTGSFSPAEINSYPTVEMEMAAPVTESEGGGC